MILIDSLQVRWDFRPGHDNSAMDKVGLLTSNRSIPDGFILINYDSAIDDFTHAIAWHPTLIREWQYVCDL